MTHTGNILFTILKSDEYLFCQYILVPSQCLFFDYWAQWDFLVYLFVCLFSPINNIWSSLGLEIVSDSPPLDYLRRVNKVWRSYSRCLWSAISFPVRGWCSPTTPTSCHTGPSLWEAHTPRWTWNWLEETVASSQGQLYDHGQFLEDVLFSSSKQYHPDQSAPRLGPWMRRVGQSHSHLAVACLQCKGKTAVIATEMWGSLSPQHNLERTNWCGTRYKGANSL